MMEASSAVFWSWVEKTSVLASETFALCEATLDTLVAMVFSWLVEAVDSFLARASA